MPTSHYRDRSQIQGICVAGRLLQNEGVNSELADFVQCGLFFNDKAEKRRLYLHQYNALKEAAINRKNIVVTTGTGSGKTECFLLPILPISYQSRAHGTKRIDHEPCAL